VKGRLESWVSAPPAEFTLKQCRVWTCAMPAGLVRLASPQPSLSFFFSFSLAPPEECPTHWETVQKETRDIWLIKLDFFIHTSCNKFYNKC